MQVKRVTAAGLVAVLCAAVFVVVAHAASPFLIAIGTIPGFYEDFATETAGPLENGLPGNLLGGIGSALAYGGGDNFLSIPDRGPNAVPYNTCTDDTTSYINRVQTLHMTLSPSNPEITSLPFTLTPMLVDTTLLSSTSPLIYGPGCGAAGSGEPALNRVNHTHYFTGRSDNFGAGVSTDPSNARLDGEGIRISPDGNHIYITDEYGPYVYDFDARSGNRIKVYTLPSEFAVPFPNAMGGVEISGNTIGRVANKGMEGLAITPDGKTLVGAMQSPLIQDGGDNKGGVTRIVTIDANSGKTHQYAYQLDTGTKTTISEILAVNDHQFLVDERDSKGLGDDPPSEAKFKKLYLIDLQGAFDIIGLSGQSALAAHAVAKTEFLDIVAVLTGSGMTKADIPAKLEGIAFGQDVTINGHLKHTLYVANDNDFLPMVHKFGVVDKVMNPNRFFVFAFDQADLPGYVAQLFNHD